MSEPKQGQVVSPKPNQLLAPKDSQARHTGELLSGARPKTAGAYTGETLLRTRPRTYYKVLRLLADPDWSAIAISKACKVSEKTIAAISERRRDDITERKKQITSTLCDVAVMGSERMSEKIGHASLRDAAIGTGIAVDKMIALTGGSPAVQVAILNVPSEAEREERRRIDARLDELTRRLMESS